MSAERTMLDATELVKLWALKAQARERHRCAYAEMNAACDALQDITNRVDNAKSDLLNPLDPDWKDTE